MLKKIGVLKQSVAEKEMLKQATVQCNETCKIKLSGKDDSVKVRVRRLYWDGFAVDQIPYEKWESRNSSENFIVKFSVPRQFGQVKLELLNVKHQKYVDVISGKEMVSIEVFLDDDPQLQNIRDFLTYRNKSFIRRSKRRLKKTLTEKTLYVFWVFIGLFAIFCGLLYLKDSLFG